MIEIHEPTASSTYAWRDIRAAVGVREVEPGTARAIASWYQSPGAIGRELAGLACGGRMITSEVLEDIAATRREFPRDYQSTESNWLALDMLATYVLKNG